jgi:hypothetical protein
VVLAAVLNRVAEVPGDQEAAALGVRIGTRLSGEIIPPEPERLGADASGVIDRIWRLMAAHAERSGDPEPAALALRLGRVVLDRGTPTAQGLRELAALAAAQNDARTELDAWRALLSAARPEEEAWWEARYQTMRLLTELDPDAAKRAIEQHRVLHPGSGIAPWAGMIDALFVSLPPVGVGSSDGGAGP